MAAFINRLINADKSFSGSTGEADVYTDRKSYGLLVSTRIDQLAFEEQGLLALLFTGAKPFLEIEDSLLKCLPEGLIKSQFMDVVKEIVAQNLTMVSRIMFYSYRGLKFAGVAEDLEDRFYFLHLMLIILKKSVGID